MSENIIAIVNKALQVYHNTGTEEYPEARAIDKLEELCNGDMRLQQQCFNVLQWSIQQIDKEVMR